MTSPAQEFPPFPEVHLEPPTRQSSEENREKVDDNGVRLPDMSVDSRALRERLRIETMRDQGARFDIPRPSPSRTREEGTRLDDELAMLKAERLVTAKSEDSEDKGSTIKRSRSRVPEPVDEFDTATNPIHEKHAVYKPPEDPATGLALFFNYVHRSGFILRYFVYIVPTFIILLTPILIGALAPVGQNANVGGVKLAWFGVWLEIVWLTLWAGRFVSRMIPYPFGLIASLFTNNAKKWRDMGKQLELPATIFFWWLAIEVSFLPTMKNHHVDGDKTTKSWEVTMNKIIISIFVGAVLNFIEKIIIQLIAMSFHVRTYSDRIELNKFQIGSLTKLYIFSRTKITMADAEFEEKPSGAASGTKTPALYAEKAQVAVNKAFKAVGDVTGTIAGDFTGKKITKSSHPSSVILALLNSTSGSQILARRLYRTFVRDDFETVFQDDLKAAFDNDEEAEAAFSMFDKDMNGDISMEELEAVCVEIGRERKSITASLKDLDSVVGKLDRVLLFVVVVITILVLISLISTSAAGVLTSAGSTVLALSWLFSATAQEFLQSCIFVFIKHPFDVGDRVAIYGNTGATLKGDDYYVKEIALLYTEFKKMEGHVVQAPNNYLNTLFILNQRRSGGLAEAVPIVIRFGTSLEQIEGLRNVLLEFVKAEKREFQANILTELRDVTEAYSLTLNVVFFYKSNWQNELLRLQRRNKFICAMMTAMQDLGIEGPRRNNAGWRPEVPMYFNSPPGAPPTYSTNLQDGNEEGSEHQQNMTNDSTMLQHSATMNHRPTIRRQPSTGQIGRPRGESLSQMAKRVDFSLGMTDVASSGTLSDFYEDRCTSRFADVIRESNRAEEQRRASQDIADSAARATGRSSSNDEGSVPRATGILRRSTTQSFGQRRRGPSVSSTETHRNRFLSRLGHPRRSTDMPRDSLAEEGRMAPIDPRSGYVGTQAVRMESVSSIPEEGPEQAQFHSQTQDFVARRYAPQSSRT